MRKFLLAWQFLTILPVRVKGPVSESELAAAAAFFPLAGAFSGLLTAALAYLFSLAFPAAITAGLTVLLLTVIIGGFHLDGLADTFDALAVKSTGDRAADREKRLAVMKDSNTGAMGVIAIVLDILLKYLLLAEILLTFGLHPFLATITLMSTLSKWAMVMAIGQGKPARQDGLARIFFSFRTALTPLWATLWTGAICLFVMTGGLPGGISLSAVTLVLIPISLYLFSLGAVRLCNNRFGGLTGDNFGAINELSEIIILLGGIIWLRHSI